MAQKSLGRGDNDTIPVNEDGSPQVLIVSPPTGLSVKNGNTGTFTVALPCKPTASTTVKTTIIDAGYGLTVQSGGTLTFTTGNFATPQTVTLASAAGQAGYFRILISPSGPDVPGFEAVIMHVLVS